MHLAFPLKQSLSYSQLAGFAEKRKHWKASTTTEHVKYLTII